MKKNIVIFSALLLSLCSCNDFFDTKLTNEKGEQQLTNDPNIIRGFITFAYRTIPSNFDYFGNDFLDCATDNAVSNNLTGGMNMISSQEGYWSNTMNPLDNWNTCYENIRALNDFIERGLGDDIKYKTDSDENALYKNRIKGEAFFLRACNEFELLRRFSGIDTDDKLMGFPIVTERMKLDEVKQLPRNSFDECVTQIISDLNIALSAGLPEKYNGGNDITDETNVGRPTTVACKALKSRVLLYAASPAYNLNGDVERYKTAAKAAKDVIDMIGFTLPNIYNVDNISTSFYNNDGTDELILRRVTGGKNGDTGIETRNFPPTVGLIGKGTCNPSQNLADAFPMKNGYPIDNPMSMVGDNRYENRDPRFYNTILYNGSHLKGVEIQTYNGGNSMVGATGVTEQNFTRTGYYLRKWVSSKVNLIVGNVVNDVHYYAMFRKAEMFLNFAEAANKAYGPDGNELGFTARQAIREVRRRAGIAPNGDDYLNSLTTADQLEKLIKNERRIELCFENHRFFDLRRWKENLNEPVKGIIFENQNDKVGKIVTVNTPVYKDYMIYGPIPNAERLKCPLITQNKGW